MLEARNVQLIVYSLGTISAMLIGCVDKIRRLYRQYPVIFGFMITVGTVFCVIVVIHFSTYIHIP